MSTSFDFKRLRRFITIYAVVQVVLILLLVYMAVNFQAGLQPQRFLRSVIATLVIQLMLFYPIRKFAASEAAREVEACATNLDADRLKAMRTRRTIGDVVKCGVFIFFVTFILKMPDNRFILSIIFFTFILTFLSYFQCFNFAAKREMKLKA